VILSHKLKFLFIAVPKTGTHAYRFALRPHLGESDEEQVGLFVNKRFSNDEIAKIKHGHITAGQMKKVLDPKIWNTYYKYAVVRNPWDRYISFCFFMHRKNPDFQKNPTTFLNRIIENPKARKRILFVPQSEFLYDDNGELLVDELGRFENLQTSYDAMAHRLNIDGQKLEKINNSEHGLYRKYYDEALKEKVGEFYKADIEHFNYKY